MDNQESESSDNSVENAKLLIEITKGLSLEIHPNLLSLKSAGLDSSLDRDFGLDSLGRMELMSRIERNFGVVLSERVYAEAETPRDLVRAISGLSAEKGKAGNIERVNACLEGILEYPHDAQTLSDVLNWHVEAHPERPHIRFYSDEGEGGIITYGQLREKAIVLASGLQHSGILPGDRVAIMLASDEDYFTAFFGVVMAGAVPVPIYPPFRKTQIEDHLRRHATILGNCGAVCLITMPEAKIVAVLLKSQVESLKNVITVDELVSIKGGYSKPIISARDIALLQYTSGSTGDPKGVIVTHENLLANIRAMGDAIRISSSDVFVSWLPLYHDMGLIGAWLGSLYFGISAVIMSPLTFLTKPRRWLQAIHKYKGTLSAAPNFAYEMMAVKAIDSELEGLDLSSWRFAFNGAEPVNPDTAERFCNRFVSYGFRKEAFAPVYGLAECSVGLAFPPPERGPLVDRIGREAFVNHGKAVPASGNDSSVMTFMACGQPLAGHEIRIIDERDREVPERHEGRLQFRGPSACSGYFRNPEQTSRLIRDGWLESGDRAYVAGGDVYITGRIKDMIIRAGRNIYPQELEAVVGMIEGIRTGNVAVFGSCDPISKEEKLVVAAETRQTAKDEIGKLRSQIISSSVDLLGLPPDDIVLLPPGSILKTSSGKIRRSANRLLYEKGHMTGGKGSGLRGVVSLLFTGIKVGIRRYSNLFSENFYSAWCWLLFGLIAPFSWIMTLALSDADKRWAFLHNMAGILARLSMTSISVGGLENLRSSGPCIIVVNHSSYVDNLVLAAVLPERARFVAKAELKSDLIARLFLDKIDTEYVERFDAGKGVEDARRIAGKAGGSVPLLFFPEGTFSRMPGLLPFHMGAFITSAQSGLPIVPVTIRGTRSILRADSWFVRRGRVMVNIGEPMMPEKNVFDSDGSLWSEIIRLRDMVRDFMLRRTGEPDLGSEKSPLYRLKQESRL